MQKFFDGHNDLLLRLWMENDIHADLFFVGGNLYKSPVTSWDTGISQK